MNVTINNIIGFLGQNWSMSAYFMCKNFIFQILASFNLTLM